MYLDLDIGYYEVLQILDLETRSQDNKIFVKIQNWLIEPKNCLFIEDHNWHFLSIFIFFYHNSIFFRFHFFLFQNSHFYQNIQFYQNLQFHQNMDKKLKMEVYLPQKFKKLQNILVTFFLDFLWFENLWRSEISNLFLGKWSLTRLSSYTELYLSMTNTQKIRRSVRLKKQTSHFWPGNVVKVFYFFYLIIKGDIFASTFAFPFANTTSV